jgi:hypothetical protein
MRAKYVGNKADQISMTVHNAEASATIPMGAPVVLVMNATGDGLDVVLPSTSTAQKIQGLRYGVATRAMAVGDFAESVVFGFTNTLLLYRQTRSDSTGNWLTEAARSVGEFLGISSAINGFVTTAGAQILSGLSASTATATTTPLATITVYNADAVLCQTLASYASSASATSDTRTAITAAVKAFVRLM